jgi:hypothetical protein
MRRILSFSFILFITSLALAAPKLEKLGPFPGNASDALKSALSPEGFRVYLPNTLVGCDIWLAANVKSKPTHNKDAHGSSYPQFSESQFLGVITFPKGGGSDFRGQPIRSGSYTMRYIMLPNDGNHLGVAPNPDFVVIIPLADDPDPSATFDFEQLVDLSRKASRTAHPATFEMMPPESAEPSVSQTDDGWIVFHAAITSGSKTIPIAVVIKGSAAQ